MISHVFLLNIQLLLISESYGFFHNILQSKFAENFGNNMGNQAKLRRTSII